MSTNVDQAFLYVLGIFKGGFGLFNAYLVVFGLFLPKTEEKNYRYLFLLVLKNISKKKNLNVNKGGKGGWSSKVDNN